MPACARNISTRHRAAVGAGLPGIDGVDQQEVQVVADLKGMRIRAASTVADALSYLGTDRCAAHLVRRRRGAASRAVDGMASAPFDSAVGNGLQEGGGRSMNDAGRMGINSITTPSGINKARALRRAGSRSTEDDPRSRSRGAGALALPTSMMSSRPRPRSWRNRSRSPWSRFPAPKPKPGAARRR